MVTTPASAGTASRTPACSSICTTERTGALTGKKLPHAARSALMDPCRHPLRLARLRLASSLGRNNGHPPSLALLSLAPQLALTSPARLGMLTRRRNALVLFSPAQIRTTLVLLLLTHPVPAVLFKVLWPSILIGPIIHQSGHGATDSMLFATPAVLLSLLEPSAPCKHRRLRQPRPPVRRCRHRQRQ